MHKTLLALGAGAALSVASFGAQALPGSPDGAFAGAPMIEKVIGGDGCGPNAFRGRSGYCRPLRRGPPAYGYYGGAPRAYAPRYYGGPQYYAPAPRYYAPPRPGLYLGF